MSSSEQYPGKIEFEGASFGYIPEMDKKFKGEDFDYVYTVKPEGEPEHVVNAVHRASILANKYRFEDRPPDFSALPGNSYRVYEIVVNQETQQAVLFVADKLEDIKLPDEFTDTYKDMQKEMGVGRFDYASPEDIEKFQTIFSGFIDHIVSKQ